MRAWRNEFTRVICDRLISVEDQTLMRNHTIKMLAKSFPYEPKISEMDEGGDEVQQIDLTEYAMRDPLLFGDFRNAAGELYLLPFFLCF